MNFVLPAELAARGCRANIVNTGSAGQLETRCCCDPSVRLPGYHREGCRAALRIAMYDVGPSPCMPSHSQELHVYECAQLPPDLGWRSIIEQELVCRVADEFPAFGLAAADRRS